MTLEITTTIAFLRDYRSSTVARMERPNNVSDEEWHRLATMWGATIQGAVLAKTP